MVTQAHYTLLVSGGDPNLCRAYLPFNCRHYQTGNIYSYHDSAERIRYSEKQPNGESAWVDEHGVPWSKTDVHAETTHNALMQLGYVCHEKYRKYELPHGAVGSPAFPRLVEGEGFKDVRGKGKMFNFMANYGGGKGAAMKSLDLDDTAADALVKGYAESFPHVKIYQDAIVRAHMLKGYVRNLYGRRYYLSEPRKAYKLANYNVQGTCADALKQAIIDLDSYILENKLKSKIVMPIHDEVIFDIYAGEEQVKQKFMEIMQQAFSWCLVPVTAGVEVTYTDWASKKEIA